MLINISKYVSALPFISNATELFLHVYSFCFKSVISAQGGGVRQIYVKPCCPLRQLCFYNFFSHKKTKQMQLFDVVCLSMLNQSTIFFLHWLKFSPILHSSPLINHFILGVLQENWNLASWYSTSIFCLWGFIYYLSGDGVIYDDIDIVKIKSLNVKN